jgi:putative serine protease PepD
MGGRRRLLAAAVALALVSGGVGGGIGALVADNDHSTTQVVNGSGLTRSTDTNPVSPAADNTVSKAAQVILPSVVTISEVGSNEAGTGSGVIIRSDGYILTNNHVVSGASGAAGSLTVTLQSGDTVNATVVGTDPSSDLAVVKINKTGLTPATFGDSDALQIGEQVVAVGSPLGLSGTVTSGIVSAVHRPVRTGDSQVQDANAVLDAIQTDAPINPGNSGGPLVNSKGQIVGINSAIATVDSGSSSPFGGQQQQSGNIGVGFAIASNYAQKIAQQLITNHKAVHPYLGVNAQDAGNDPTGTGIGGDGATIQNLVGGGPAQQAGLQAGDIITKVNDRTVSDVDALIAAVRAHEIGESVTVTYTRNGQTQTAKVTLAQQPSSYPTAPKVLRPGRVNPHRPGLGVSRARPGTTHVGGRGRWLAKRLDGDSDSSPPPHRIHR